ncbi:hypothetical protein NDU88_011606 [Pleurodeles waltl]|uniref:Uncharacterized protein n=1 Tax=Pleurodeles waltl TaxID=8319 RepID=A0AAV7S347_PLEWA|nr:hypothetical protein NDU88_011606 [Pleurodeles waltl]
MSPLCALSGAPQGPRSDPTVDSPSYRREEFPPGKSTRPQHQGAAGALCGRACLKGAPEARALPGATVRPSLPRLGKHCGRPMKEARPRTLRNTGSLGGPLTNSVTKKGRQSGEMTVTAILPAGKNRTLIDIVTRVGVSGTEGTVFRWALEDVVPEETL